jgi:rod shape-determining protein MreC
LKQLLDILSLFKEYLVLALCLLLSALLLSLNDNPQIRSIRSTVVVAIGFAQDIFGSIPNPFTLQKENQLLRQRNVTLADEVSLLRESKLENIRLRKLLGLRDRSPYRYVPGNVVGKNEQLMRTTITIDVGENDGAGYNMPVVTDAGLVGKIIAASGHYAIAQVMLHKDFRVSARIQRARADGILFWNGEDLQIKNVPRTQDVKPGDLVLTSSLSTVYPEGIKIGVVSSAEIVAGALFYTIKVDPTVNFSALEEVFVISQIPDSARVALEQLVTK